jgi:hypothetical protein
MFFSYEGTRGERGRTTTTTMLDIPQSILKKKSINHLINQPINDLFNQLIIPSNTRLQNLPRTIRRWRILRHQSCSKINQTVHSGVILML